MVRTEWTLSTLPGPASPCQIRLVDLPAARWLGLCTSTAGDVGSTPGQRTKILPLSLAKNNNKKIVANVYNRVVKSPGPGVKGSWWI